MKRTLLLIPAILLTISAFSQRMVCNQDTVHFYQTQYRGNLIWQQSLNGADWSTIPGTQGDTLMVVATGSAYYRTEVTEGQCKPYYSDAVHLAVNETPIVRLAIRDSVCGTEPAFILDGGAPEGGSYSGDGVVDGKFIPAFAGNGEHKIYYSYRDSATGCADSTFAFISVVPVPNSAQAGDDIPFVPADSVLLEANSPENGIGTWSILSGTVGHFSDPHDPNAVFYRDSGNLNFTLRWSISGNCRSSSDDLKIVFFPLSRNPCPGAPTVTDADGNIYPTVQIGEQCWMAKNMNVGIYRSSSVSVVEHSNLFDNGLIEKYCLNNNPDSCKLYGGLYDWDEAMGYSKMEGSQGICPEGWHVPSYRDWNTLDELYTWGEAGKQIKIGGNSGFDGYYGGDRHPMGEFYSNGTSGFFWVSTEYISEGINDAYIREIASCNEVISTEHFSKKTGLSVRCIKNNH